jgi:hypothetical protein
MEEIITIKNKILAGENLTENYNLLVKLVENRKSELKKYEKKILKENIKKVECEHILKIDAEIGKMEKYDYINSDMIKTYRKIQSKINYMKDYYEKNSLTLKKIQFNHKKKLTISNIG